MFCIHCGKENPDESTYCLRCGERMVTGRGVGTGMLIMAACAAAVSIMFGVMSLFGDQLKFRQATPASAAATPSPTVSPTQPVTEVEMVPAGENASGPLTIVSQSIRIEPGSFRSFGFEVEERQGAARVMGEVTAAGGGRDDIYLLILDDAGLDDYRKGRGFSAFLEQRVTDTRRVSATLPPGTFHVVLSNKHARFYPKRVRAVLALSYE